MPATRRPAKGLTGGWVLGEAGAVLKAAATLAPGVAYAPQADGTQAGYTTFAKGPFGGPSYAKKVTFGTQRRLRRGIPGVLHQEPAGGLGGHSRRHHRQGPLPRLGGPARGRTRRARSTTTTPAPPRAAPRASSPSGPTRSPRRAGSTPPASPGTGVTTFGNNADTYANWSNFLAPVDEAPRPVSPTGSFSYAFTDAWQQKKGATVPPSYAEDLNPAATNLFFQHNRIHDDYYALGFTETAGNFQVDNGGKGGMGGDAIKGLVQAGAASGGSPDLHGARQRLHAHPRRRHPAVERHVPVGADQRRLRGPLPRRLLDMTVIQHEYSHGLSNRYVAGGSALGSHQAGSMGEGWGDWYALNHAFRTGLETTRAVVGAYATGNDLRGIRNYDYNKNPNTFGDIGYDLTGPEVHADGEIWTATLWDLNKALVAKYGLAKGSEVAARLVTDGMPLTAPTRRSSTPATGSSPPTSTATTATTPTSSGRSSPSVERAPLPSRAPATTPTRRRRSTTRRRDATARRRSPSSTPARASGSRTPRSSSAASRPGSPRWAAPAQAAASRSRRSRAPTR